MPNNRQWAVLLWLGVLLGLALARPDLRSSVRGLVRTALDPVLLLPLAMMAAWVAGLGYAAAIVGLWESDLATDTAFWFVFAGLILFGSFDERASGSTSSAARRWPSWRSASPSRSSQSSLC